MNSVRQQVQLAEVVTSLYTKGHVDLAADIIVLSGTKNGKHVLFDDKDLSSVFMETLHELLDNLGFENIMKVSKKRAKELEKLPPAFDAANPSMISLIRK